MSLKDCLLVVNSKRLGAIRLRIEANADKVASDAE